MNLIDFPSTGRKLYVPSSFADCDRQQARDVSQVLVYYMMHQSVSYEDLLIDILVACTNMKHRPEKDDVAYIHIAQLSRLCDSWFEDVDGKKEVRLDHIDNPFTWLRTGLIKYHGPKDVFDNVTFGEYVDAMNYYSEFLDSQDVNYLDLLLATLFRKNVPLSRKRKPYTKNDTVKKAKRFKRLCMGYRYGFFLYFASFQKYLSTAKIYWEGRELDLKIIFAKQEEGYKSTIPGLGMLSVQFDMAQSGVMGNERELRERPFWEVIALMYDMKKRDLDEAAAQKAAKP
jgi:hypothetical protein